MRKFKEKRSPEAQTTLQYLVDEYILFVRDFTIESPLTPDQVRQNLEKLDTPQPSGCISHFPVEINVDFYESGEERTFFDITLKRYQKNKYGGNYRPSSHAEGQISVDNEQTTVTGKVTVAGARFWGGIVAALALYAFISTVILRDMDLYSTPWIENVGWALPFLIGIMIFQWYRMYTDRNTLLRMVEGAATHEYYHPDFQESYEYADKEKRKHEQL